MKRLRILWLFMALVLLGVSSIDAAIVELVLGKALPGEAGLAPRHPGSLLSPFGCDFDTEGNLYVVELEGGRVHRLGTDGRLTVIAGNGTKGYVGDGMPVRSAVFNGMHNLAIDSKNQLYISDSWNHCVRRIDLRTGLISTVSGNGIAGFRGDGGAGIFAEYNFLMCLTLSSTSPALLIADLKNRRIRRHDLETELVITLAGNGQRGIPSDGAVAVEAPLVDPRAVAADSQNRLYVLERGGHALRRIDVDGRIWTVVGDGQAGDRDGIGRQARLNSPKHLCVDAHDRVVIADDQNAVIRLYDPETNEVRTLLGRGQFGQGVTLKRPHGVTVEGAWLYVVDTGNHRILRFPVP